MNKKSNNTKVLTQKGIFNLKQISEFEVVGLKKRVKTSNIGICLNKKVLKDGFKNVLEASKYVDNHKFNNSKKIFI